MSKKIDFGFCTQHRKKGSEIIELAKLAEDLGFGSFWYPEDPYQRGVFVTIATIAAHTKKLMIGTCVMNVFMRHPVSIAQEWAALDEFSEGRAILGISAGHPSWLREQLNLPWEKPLTAVRETVDIFESLIAGEAVTYDGNIFKISNPDQAFLQHLQFSEVELRFPPVKSKIPIHLGAGGPKNLQFCGERLDGFLMVAGASTSAKAMAYAYDNLKIGAIRAGRNADDIDVTLPFLLLISENDQQARDQMKSLIAAVLISNCDSGLGEQYEKRGWLPVSYLKELKEASLRGEEPADFITDDVLDDYSVSGSPERCIELITKMTGKGINRFVIHDWGEGGKLQGIDFNIEASMRLFAEKVMPEFL